jgi:hypothetical protein
MLGREPLEAAKKYRKGGGARQPEAVWVRESSGSETVVLAIKAARVVTRQFDFDSVSAWDGADEGSDVHS